jgi:hypothetical protein
MLPRLCSLCRTVEEAAAEEEAVQTGPCPVVRMQVEGTHFQSDKVAAVQDIVQDIAAVGDKLAAALGRVAAQDREVAALDRVAAALDREAAALDRAALDREVAAADTEAAAQDIAADIGLGRQGTEGVVLK